MKPELLKDLHLLFEEYMHYSICDAKVSESEMKRFLGELFGAISSIGMRHSMFKKPKNVNEVKRLEKITLVHNVQKAAYKIDEAYIYNLQQRTIPVELEVELARIKFRLMDVLTEYFAMFEREELKGLSNLELLELVRECIAENP